MVQELDTIYLVDGSSYIYRAYHAIRHLSNSKGFPTNAIFGFTKMILKLMNDKSPKYMAVAFDAKGPTFRHELYDDYKATRPPMPEDLVIQLSHIHGIVENLNILMIEKPGYEADDILGTLARLGEEKGYQVVIITGDKDFRQLISPRISLWDTMKDKMTDYEVFLSEYELEPSQMVDLMGLSGDSSDNIPGVPGVGEKTAAALIREYGSMDNVFDHLDEIKGKKLKENLEKARDNAYLSKTLVTIDCSVPLQQAIDDLRTEEPDREALAKIFRDLEFKGLWDQFASQGDPVEKDYRLCLSEEQLVSLREEIVERGLVSIDTETTSQDPLQARLVGISFSIEENRAYYLPLAHQYLGAPEQVDLQKGIEILKPLLEDENIAKIGQNIKYDALVLKGYGVELSGIHFDTMVASYVLNPGLRQHNLDALAQHYLNNKMINYK
jgi:DNA polymerase-1